MGVSTISSKICRSCVSSEVAAHHFTRCLTSVFGTLALTPYIDIWSPLYVAHPNASSDRSPVPSTMPPTWLAMSISSWVRSRACEFSYVTSCTFMSCPISAKCCLTAAVIDISREVTFSDFISSTALSCVRSVVPKPGIVTPMIPLRSNPSTSNVRTATRRASVESNPPDMPITRFWCSLHAIFVQGHLFVYL